MPIRLVFHQVFGSLGAQCHGAPAQHWAGHSGVPVSAVTGTRGPAARVVWDQPPHLHWHLSSDSLTWAAAAFKNEVFKDVSFEILAFV